jgi:hypothetical protein
VRRCPARPQRAPRYEIDRPPPYSLPGRRGGASRKRALRRDAVSARDKQLIVPEIVLSLAAQRDVQGSENAGVEALARSKVLHDELQIVGRTIPASDAAARSRAVAPRATVGALWADLSSRAGVCRPAQRIRIRIPTSTCSRTMPEPYTSRGSSAPDGIELTWAVIGAIPARHAAPRSPQGESLP